jgi:integrase
VLQYKQIHEVANSHPFLQIAMDISLHTGMRRGDIVALRWDAHVTGKWLKKQIRKSHEKLGADDGVNLKWNLAKHQTLKATIDYARELSLKHWRCPWVLSRMPLRRVKGASKEHHAQVSAKMISDTFTECALACGIEGTGFDEIRALKSWLHKKAGHDQKLIQALMAHTSEGMTALYQAGHETIWHEVNLVLPDDLLKYP